MSLTRATRINGSCGTPALATLGEALSVACARGVSSASLAQSQTLCARHAYTERQPERKCNK